MLEATFPMAREQVMLRTQSEPVVEVMSKVAPLFLTPHVWVIALATVLDRDRKEDRCPLRVL